MFFILLIIFYFKNTWIYFKLAHNGLRAGDRGPVLRLRQGYGACTLLAVVFLSFSKVINKLFYPFVN